MVSWRDVREVVHFAFRGTGVSKFSPAKVLAHAFEEVDVGNRAWTEAMSVDVLHVREIVSVSVGIPLLVGVGPTHRQSVVKAEGFDAGGDSAIGAPTAPRGRKVDIKSWFPRKQEE